MSNMIIPASVRSVTPTKDGSGFIITVDESIIGDSRATVFGAQSAPKFGRSFSTKANKTNLVEGTEISLDLNLFDQVDKEFEITDPNSDRYGEMATKTWLFPK